MGSQRDRSEVGGGAHDAVLDRCSGGGVPCVVGGAEGEMMIKFCTGGENLIEIGREKRLKRLWHGLCYEISVNNERNANGI